jgi:glycosyltransferase involved in cell wall biosynthesis
MPSGKEKWRMGNKQKTIVCFGAGPAFKGGMSNYNTSLAKSLATFDNVKVHIVSWTQQYPSIVPREFKDKVSALDFLEGSDISIKYLTNYNNPLYWAATARYICSLQPDKVILQWSIAIQGLPIGYLVNKIKKLCDCEVILDLHFVVQKEKSKIDEWLTKRGIASADTYIVHAYNTYHELQELFPKKKFFLTLNGARAIDQKTAGQPVIKLFHPIYDLYQPDPDFNVAAFKKENGLKEQVFLFFGFIRKYKGLHDAIQAFEIVSRQRDDVSFLICGELFWNTLESGSVITKVKKFIFSAAKRIFLNQQDDERDYNPLALIDSLHLQDKTKVVSTFIPNEDVHKYFQVANAAVLFYSRATPSGIESLSYNFNLPILTSNVGHFPETIKDGINGYIAKENTIASMAETMLRFLDHPIPPERVAGFKNEFSWKAYSAAILNENSPSADQ